MKTALNYKPRWRNLMLAMDDSQAGGSGGGSYGYTLPAPITIAQALPAQITYIDPLLSSSSASFVSIWGNTFTLKANGERPYGITDIEWAGYLTEQEMLRPGVTDAQDVIFARQMNIIAQQNAIAVSDNLNNQKILDAQKAVDFGEALKTAAVQQQLYPDVPFLTGTTDELMKMQTQAANLGITIPLKATLITPSGAVSQNIVTLTPGGLTKTTATPLTTTQAGMQPIYIAGAVAGAGILSLIFL